MNTQPKLEQPVRGLLSVPKGTLTVGQLMGSWPGNETDEEIAEVLARLRNWDLTLNEEESIMSEAQEPKPQKINRMDPLWTASAAVALNSEAVRVNALPEGNPNKYLRIGWCANQADAMLRERDRRDREERE